MTDPSPLDTRSEPKDVRDLMVQTRGSWVLAFDNLSHLPPWLSDAVCALATGGGFSTRELHTNDDEIVFTAKRPVILAGIEDVTTRGDRLTPFVSDLKRVRDTLGADLVKAVTTPDQLGGVLFADPERLVACLYDLTRAEKAGVSPEQFAAAFDADALDRAGFALVEAGLPMTPLRKRAAEVVATLRAKLAQAGGAAGEAAAGTAPAPPAYAG